MLTFSKKGGITKIIVWVIILLVIIGTIYMTYKYVSKDKSSDENNNIPEGSNTQDRTTTINVNVPTSDTEKPPVPPE